ncbi:PD-(D/E)XK nuclease family protein [Almyronema epifaneia]|uniref:PD-(D/E)XK nuclease family protein n=1 Tax=Almyronema epifaneia S1 TaxID=2991925 RepID=A0ABW6IC47_9CYAN
MTVSLATPQPPLPLSQGSLNLLTTCPRKFQYTYFDELGLPLAADQQANVAWGSQFHLLMQQRELGLPIDALAATETDLQESLEQLVKAAPALFAPELASFRQSEHRRTLEFAGYLLTVIYDLIILQPQRGQIIDWKTYLQPRDRTFLAQDWQTRLYPYVLAETTTLSPHQISITYWFVRHRDRQSQRLQPQQQTFQYSEQQHEQTRHDLSQLTAQLHQWRSQPAALPKVDLAKGICPSCPFAIRCQRSLAAFAPPSAPPLPNLEAIEEIEL